MATDDDGNKLQIDVIDVGQGDCILVEFPNRETMLIDSGNRFDEGEKAIAHLRERDIDYIDHIDHFVATHYDSDHIGGHARIIEEFGSDGIGAVYGPGGEIKKKRQKRISDITRHWKRLEWRRSISKKGPLKSIPRATIITGCDLFKSEPTDAGGAKY